MCSIVSVPSIFHFDRGIRVKFSITLDNTKSAFDRMFYLECNREREWEKERRDYREREWEKERREKRQVTCSLGCTTVYIPEAPLPPVVNVHTVVLNPILKVKMTFKRYSVILGFWWYRHALSIYPVQNTACNTHCACAQRQISLCFVSQQPLVQMLPNFVCR